MTDEQMDARLAAAGERWRAAVATAERATAAAPVELRGADLVRGRSRARRRGVLLSAALVAAAIVIGGGFAVRASLHEAPTSGADAAALRGTVWRLVQYGGVRQAGSTSSLYIGADDRYVADDACQVLAGPAEVDRPSGLILTPDVIRSLPCTDSAGEVTFGPRAVEAFMGVLHFAISGSSLTITPSAGPALHLVAAPALLPPVEDVPSLQEATWTMTGVRAAGGPVRTPPNTPTFRLHDGGLVAGDGCNTLSGDAAVDGAAIDTKQLAMTAIGCSPAVGAVATTVDGVLQSRSLRWSLTADLLTLSAKGVGTLTYRWSPDDRAATDPARLRATTWSLRSIADTPVGFGARLHIGADGALTGTDGCQSLHGRIDVGHGFLTTSGVPATSNGTCPTGSATLNSFLRAPSVRWRIEDGRLVLYGGGAQAFSAVFSAVRD